MPATLAAILDDIKSACTVAGLGLMEFTLEPFAEISGDLDAADEGKHPDTRGLELVVSLMDKFRDYFASGR